MSSKVKVLAFAGSERSGSFNVKLVKYAGSKLREMGADVTVVDLKDYPMPLYNGDLEEEKGIPDSVMQFKELMKGHEGFIISSPEYNSSISPLLKNVIDWVSRPVPGESPLEAYKGKLAGILSASPGAMGGMRGLVHLRSILGNIGVLLLPEQVAVPNAHEAFDPSGNLTEEGGAARVEAFCASYYSVASKLSLNC